MERTIKKVEVGDIVVAAYRDGAGIIIAGLIEQGLMKIDEEIQKYYKVSVGDYHLTLLEDELDCMMRFKLNGKKPKKKKGNK